MFLKKTLSPIDRCQQSALMLDIYGRPFKWILPGQKDTYQTFCGFLLSMVTFITIMTYGSLMLTSIVSKENYRV
jgi:hypothetical protein